MNTILKEEIAEVLSGIKEERNSIHIETGKTYRKVCRLSLNKFESLIQKKNNILVKLYEIEVKGVILNEEQKLEEEERV